MKRTALNATGNDRQPAETIPLDAATASPSPSIRWLMRRDLAYVLRIEFEACADPWGQDDILTLLCEKNVIGSVAVLDETPVGYCIYAWDKRAWTIHRLAVHPDFQRRGIGKLLVGRLVEKLDQRFCKTRDCIEHVIADWNLSGQLFLQKCGFRGIAVLRGGPRDTSIADGRDDDPDQYVMQRSLRAPSTPQRNAAR
jgi:ribosomal protein S18 acetylase RimI-like enzyme